MVKTLLLDFFCKHIYIKDGRISQGEGRLCRTKSTQWLQFHCWNLSVQSLLTKLSRMKISLIILDVKKSNQARLHVVLQVFYSIWCKTYRWNSAFLFISSAILSRCSTTSLICGSCCSFGLPPRSSEETFRVGSSAFIRSITYLGVKK